MLPLCPSYTHTHTKDYQGLTEETTDLEGKLKVTRVWEEGQAERTSETRETTLKETVYQRRWQPGPRLEFLLQL